MPHYSSGRGGAGVMPAEDKNAPTPPSGAPSAPIPEFIVQLQQRLADIRNELSDMMASRYGDMAVPAMSGSPKVTTDTIQQREADYLKKCRLENEESAICARLNDFLYIGTLGDYEEADEEDDDESD